MDENEISGDVEGGLNRAITIRSNAARQVAVNFVPSRQLPSNTIRLRKINSRHALLNHNPDDNITDEVDGPDQQANSIVREMEQHQQLMEDNLGAQELRREALRDLPQGLTMKRQVRSKLSASLSHRSKTTTISVWKRTKYRLGFAWKRTKDRIRNIAFSIELWYEAIRKIEGHFGSAVGSYFYFLRWLFLVDLAIMVVILCFVVTPQILYDGAIRNMDVNASRSVGVFSGKGLLENSILFYGHYHPGDVSEVGLKYSIPLAYFFTFLVLYLACFAVLCYRTAYSYRYNFIETGFYSRQVFASKVFSGWDFGIATQEAAALNARSIYVEFKELLAEQNNKTVEISFWMKVFTYLVNIVVTAIVLGFIIALEYGLWHILNVEIDVPYWEVILSGIIAVLIGVCPVLFEGMVRLEYYSPRTKLDVTLLRTCLLDFGTLFLILYFWIYKNTNCWETSFGQEMYRLVLLDAFVSLVCLPLFETIRGYMYKLKSIGSPPEFDIAYNSLSLIYNQAVLWFGMLFSPLLVCAVVAKFLLMFYVKKEVAMRACLPARKVWRAAQTQTVMYILVTLSLFITLFAIGSLFMGIPSKQCGPFTSYSFVFAVIVDALSNYPFIRSLISFTTRPGVLGFLMLGLCSWVYFMRAKSRAQRSMVQILRQMLVIEAKDKDFLLKAITKVSNGEWFYNPKEDFEPDSHTWKYLHDSNIRKPSNAGFVFNSSRLNHSLLESSRLSQHIEEKRAEDGDTDSSFSWRGSNSRLNELE